MNREETIRMAREAGFSEGMSWGDEVWEAKPGNLDRFAALAAEWGAKQEREACAKLIEHLPTQQNFYVRHLCAAAIRKRGENL